MNVDLNHYEARELLSAAALGILEGAELERLLDHAAQCTECARTLQEYRAATAGIALQLPLRPMDPARLTQLRSRLMARIRTEPQAEIPSRGPRVLPWAGWLVAAGLGGVVLVHHSVHRPIDYGWLLAGVLMLVLVAVGVYATIQHNRAAALRDRLARLEGNVGKRVSG